MREPISRKAGDDLGFLCLRVLEASESAVVIAPDIEYDAHARLNDAQAGVESAGPPGTEFLDAKAVRRFCSEDLTHHVGTTVPAPRIARASERRTEKPGGQILRGRLPATSGDRDEGHGVQLAPMRMNAGHIACFHVAQYTVHCTDILGVCSAPKMAIVETPTAAAEHLRRGLARISEGLRTGALLPFDADSSATEAAFLNRLRDVLDAAPGAAWPRLSISFNEDQVESKLWLLRHLPEAANLSQHRVVILGAWYGLLALMLNRLTPQPPAEICCIDIDEETCATASHVLSVLPSPPEVRCADMMAIDYGELSRGRPTIFVNTSCEHLPDFSGWRARVPSGTQLVLQSNNHVGCPEHVSCVPDLDTFESQARLATVDARGVLRLKHFTRFMLIGRA